MGGREHRNEGKDIVIGVMNVDAEAMGLGVIDKDLDECSYGDRVPNVNVRWCLEWCSSPRTHCSLIE